MSKGTRYKKNKKNGKFKNYILNLFMILFIVVFLYSGYRIIKYLIDGNKNQKIFEEISKSVRIDEKQEDENKYKIDFVSLKQKNSDVKGFLKVNGTNIENTVVQSKDNDYYLHRNFYKEPNSAGWIFADYRNKIDGTDKNIIIYGHNMKNGTMFSGLKDVLTEEWFKNQNNRFVTFITEKEIRVYQVFAVYQIEEEDYYMKTEFKNNEFKDYINTVKNRSTFDFGCYIGDDSNIITLSTCGNNNKHRVVLHAFYNIKCY